MSAFIQRHRNWCLFCVMAAATLLVTFQQGSLATISAKVAVSLQVDAGQLGLLSAVFFYAYAFMQIPAGLLADTLGPRKSTSLALGLASLGTLLFALAESLPVALAARVLMGLGLAVVVVPQLKLMAVWFPVSAYSRLTAIAFAISSLGLLLATTPMAYVAEAFGWRAPFLFLAGVTMIAGALVWLIVRDTPEELKILASRAGCGQSVADVVIREAPPMSREKLLHQLTRLAKKRDVWLLAAWQFCQVGAYSSFIGLWGGQYLNQGLGLEITTTGWILSLSACALIAGPLISLSAEKARSPRAVLIALSVSSTLLLLPMLLGLSLPAPVMAVYFLLFSISTTGGAALVFAAAKEHVDLALAGTTSGFVNMLAFAGGAIVQQLIGVAVKASRMGGADYLTALSRSFLVFLAAALLGLLLALLYRSPASFAGREVKSGRAGRRKA